MSKILKMKAIHNGKDVLSGVGSAVVTMSKILKMKAIHNWIGLAAGNKGLL